MAATLGAYPYDAICYITAKSGDVTWQGSGVIVGAHTVLTAAHVVWDGAQQQAMTDIRVYPGYEAGGSFIVGATQVHYNQISTPDHAMTKASSSNDFAVIDFSTDLSAYGQFTMASGYDGGSVHLTGYPASSYGKQIDQIGTVVHDVAEAVLNYGTVVATPGNSGGPLWIDSGDTLHPNPTVIGLASTTTWGTELTAADLDLIHAWQSSDAFLWATPMATASAKPAVESVSFASNGYLAINGDVAKAGMDALTHYEQYGWKEGRDPSADFDTHLYLLHNPDVKAAGIDPLQHYLQFGQFENRQSYETIGAASTITHGSFDPEYYLLANPDVARAASAAGGDPLAFAYQHYTNNGWQEHRNGDAYFDAAYYLAHNPDVAAAHMDPLAHYDAFGWKEGRNPSANFNTSAYLAANPDVAVAHIDPLTHYLQYGANESRHLA